MLKSGKSKVTFNWVFLLFCFKADIPTCIGVGPAPESVPDAMETDKDTKAPTPSEKKYYIDSTYLYTPRENVEIQSPLKDGLSEFYTK